MLWKEAERESLPAAHSLSRGDCMIQTLLPIAALFATGLVAGVLNTLAGGGSLLSLPVMIFLGLPPTVANGTLRLGILIQNVGSVWGFSRHGVFEPALVKRYLPPALAGVSEATRQHRGPA